MRFKKPQVRYADTPQPAPPSQAAGQVWDDRIGTPRVQAKNWRLMAFGCPTLALVMQLCPLNSRVQALYRGPKDDELAAQRPID